MKRKFAPWVTPDYLFKFNQYFQWFWTDRGLKPYPHQLEAIEALFLYGYKKYFLNLTRKGGKTELDEFCGPCQCYLWPNQTVYYVNKTRELGQKILWQRLKGSIKPEVLAPHYAFKKDDGIIEFANGSILQFMGCTMDPDALIGVQPAAVIFDEFRTHSPEFHDVVDPNIILPHAWSLYNSTPPDQKDIDSGKCLFYKKTMELCQAKPDKYRYVHLPCWDLMAAVPPNIKEKWLEAHDDHKRNNKMRVWAREYEAKFVYGEEPKLYHHFSKDKLERLSDLLIELRNKSKHKRLEWIVSFDTSGWSRWAVLFGCLDYDTGELFELDKIVVLGSSDETKRNEAGMYIEWLWPEVLKKFEQLNPGSTHEDWYKIWDSADQLIIDSLHRKFGNDIIIHTCYKERNWNVQGLTFAANMAATGFLRMSTLLSDLVEEIVAIDIDPDSGRMKANGFDDLLACLRYQLIEFRAVLGPAIQSEPGRQFATQVDQYWTEAIEKSEEHLAKKAIDDFDFYL